MPNLRRESAPKFCRAPTRSTACGHRDRTFSEPRAERAERESTRSWSVECESAHGRGFARDAEPAAKPSHIHPIEQASDETQPFVPFSQPDRIRAIG
jgi:hypothetical protein